MEKIYHLEGYGHVDLSHILAITECTTGYKGIPCFYIKFILSDEPTCVAYCKYEKGSVEASIMREQLLRAWTNYNSKM